jgi:hypothetical protein
LFFSFLSHLLERRHTNLIDNSLIRYALCYSAATTVHPWLDTAPPSLEHGLTPPHNQSHSIILHAHFSIYSAATTVDPLLDTAPPTLEDGLFLRFKAIAGTKQRSYFYMSTRNNNFSNRSQKATIVVDEN